MISDMKYAVNKRKNQFTTKKWCERTCLKWLINGQK